MGSALKSLLKDKSARIGVLGLGYVGLPLAMEYCRKGFRVTGFDVSRERVAGLRKGRSYIEDVSSADLRRALTRGLFSPQDRFDALSEQDALIVCVQTPLRKTKEPDIGNILAACSEIAQRPKTGRLIVLESTTFPGTTEEM